MRSGDRFPPAPCGPRRSRTARACPAERPAGAHSRRASAEDSAGARPSSSGRRDGGPASARRGRRLPDRELARARHLADDRRRVVGREGNVVERDLLLLRLLEMLRHDGAAEALLRAAVPVPRPADGEAARRRSRSARGASGTRPRGRPGSPAERRAARGSARRAPRRSSRSGSGTHPRTPDRRRLRCPCPRRGGGGGRASARAASGTETTSEPEPGRLGAGIRQRPGPEASPAEHEEERGRGPRRQAEDRVERGRERGADAADPVRGLGGLAARRPGEDVGIVRVVRRERERGEQSREQQQESDRLARETALPERFLAQRPSLSDGKGQRASAQARRGPA